MKLRQCYSEIHVPSERGFFGADNVNQSFASAVCFAIICPFCCRKRWTMWVRFPQINIQKRGLKQPSFLYMERIMGIEPTSSAWEADILPMNYIRKMLLLYHNISTISIIFCQILNIRSAFNGAAVKIWTAGECLILLFHLVDRFFK